MKIDSEDSVLRYYCGVSMVARYCRYVERRETKREKVEKKTLCGGSSETTTIVRTAEVF